MSTCSLLTDTFHSSSRLMLFILVFICFYCNSVRSKLKMEKGYAGAGSIGRVCELLKTASIWLTSIAGKILFLQPILAMIFVCNSKFMRSMTFEFQCQPSSLPLCRLLSKSAGRFQSTSCRSLPEMLCHMHMPSLLLIWPQLPTAFRQVCHLDPSWVKPPLCI